MQISDLVLLIHIDTKSGNDKFTVYSRNHHCLFTHWFSNFSKFPDRCSFGKGRILHSKATPLLMPTWTLDAGWRLVESKTVSKTVVSKQCYKRLCHKVITESWLSRLLLSQGGLVLIAHRAVGRGPYQGSAAKHSWVITSARLTLAVKTSSRFAIRSFETSFLLQNG